jgi:dihydrodipicolinate synthase/N-acetylneuraminate lyase
MPEFHGVLPALVTPFTEDGTDVDADALAAIVDRLVGAGAAVMVVPPFYEALGWRELLAHYTAVAGAIAIPIMYYNLPSASGGHARHRSAG